MLMFRSCFHLRRTRAGSVARAFRCVSSGSGVGVGGVATSLAPYLIVSGRSQPMSRSYDSVRRPPRTVLCCEWRLTIKYGDRAEQIRLVGKCHFVVSDDSQSMSRSCGNVCRLPYAVVGCEWRLTINVRVGHCGCDW